MPKFRFRFAALVRLREAVRDERRTELAEACLLENQLLARKAAASVELGSLKQGNLAALASGPVDVDRLVWAHRYELALLDQLRAIADEQAALAAELEKRRLALAAAETEVRTLEKLHDKQRARHLEEEWRSEAKALDDAAVQVYRRQTSQAAGPLRVGVDRNPDFNDK